MSSNNERACVNVEQMHNGVYYMVYKMCRQRTSHANDEKHEMLRARESRGFVRFLVRVLRDSVVD